MSMLLHICCAPCCVAVEKSLKAEGVAFTGLWYNPNIHPVTEYRARRDALIEYAKTAGFPLEVTDDYGLREFISGIYPDFSDRCGYCYRLRLERTAKEAALRGFSSFSTTLLISPYQRHELIIETAEECARRYGVEFLYRDFRPLFREGQREARELGLYMQKYCGCVFSEEERYLKKK